ncbi:MAG: pyrroline-5-carboxylate reductase [Victivallaceae bacterium]|nr:pyrroline-5-carboxylate reductase [Victivallaceae bacterium]
MNKIFFFGAGKMATAIAGGMVKSGKFRAADLTAFDVSADAAKKFTAATEVAAVSDAKKSFAAADTVLVAVKPQVVAEALAPFSGGFSGKLVISIVAGVPLEKLAALCPGSRLIRVMPNTPALVGAGAAAYAAGKTAKAADLKLAEKILSSVGSAVVVKERDLDAVTALSGSGPAYVFDFIQALADGGVAEGLTRDVALELAIETVLGSARMLRETQTHPAILRDAVTSPAGTTSRALEVLEQGGFKGLVIGAVRAAAIRSRELGK